MKPWLNSFLKISAAGPASLSGAQPATPTGITPPLNPVQQIQQQRLAAQAEPSSPAGNPEIMQAQQEAAAAQQQAEQAAQQAEMDTQTQVAQAQQEMASQKMQADQAAAADKMKADQELQTARAEVETAKAEAQLAKIESEKSIAMSQIEAAKQQHDSKVRSDEQSLQTKAQQAQVQADQAAVKQQAQSSAADPTGSVAVMSHRLQGIGGNQPAAPMTAKAKVKAANTMQMMQYGLPKAKSVAGNGVMQSAIYRPDLGGIGNKLVGAALPMIYGQPNWSQFFGAPQRQTQAMGFDPEAMAQAYGPMAQSYGADIARNLL